MTYVDFVHRKTVRTQASGFSASIDYGLFDFQRAITEWALRRGRAAVFADTGLGKMAMEIAWADQVCKHTNGSVIILAPLAVAQQLAREGRRMGVDVLHAKSGEQSPAQGITVTNYERLHLFDPARYSGVVLDESSCIKHQGSKTFTQLCEAFRDTPYKLPATATPAPNDWTELGTHAEFLGICTRAEMLSEFFCHDGGETQVWRLKGHARAEFWRWVASWAALVRKPSDLGFDDSRYNLPPLTVTQHTIEPRHAPTTGLFHTEALSLMERRQARRASLEDRVAACANLINSTDEPWLIWCDLNDESDALTAAIDGAVEICGADEPDAKESRLIGFIDGTVKRLVTKPSIAGWGLNFQHCAHMAFVGVTDSWEAYYQAVRRCWRFGQSRPVSVHIFASETEGAVVANLKRKESAAQAMAQELSNETREAVQGSILGQSRYTNDYNPAHQIMVPAFLQSEAA